MTIRSSRSSRPSSRASDSGRSNATSSLFGTYQQYPPRTSTSPLPFSGFHRPRHPQSLQEYKERINAADSDHARAEAMMRQGMDLVGRANAIERKAAADRARAQQARAEQGPEFPVEAFPRLRLRRGMVNAGNNHLPPVIENRCPDDFVEEVPSVKKAPLSAIPGWSRVSMKSKPHHEYAKVRSARPKTIWGGPAWG